MRHEEAGKEPRHVLLLVEARQRLLRRVADVRNREVVDLDGQVNPYHRAITAALDQQPRPRHGRRGARIGNLHGDPLSRTLFTVFEAQDSKFPGGQYTSAEMVDS